MGEIFSVLSNAYTIIVIKISLHYLSKTVYILDVEQMFHLIGYRYEFIVGFLVRVRLVHILFCTNSLCI